MGVSECPAVSPLVKHLSVKGQTMKKNGGIIVRKKVRHWSSFYINYLSAFSDNYPPPSLACHFNVQC